MGRMNLRLVGVSAALCIATLSGPAILGQEPKPGEAAGQKVGNAIKAAIGIAFPPVQEIIKAIWPDGTKNKKGTDSSVADALAKQQAELKRKVEVQLRAVNAELDEVRLVDAFATNASKANTFIVRVDTLLSAAPTSDDQWADVGRAFDNGGVFLKRMLDIKSDEIRRKVKDHTDQAEMLGFYDNLEVSLNDATSFLKAKKSAPMRDPIQRISLALDGFRLKGTVRLGRLAEDLGSVAKVFGADPPPPGPPPGVLAFVAGDDIRAVIKDRLESSRKQGL